MSRQGQPKVVHGESFPTYTKEYRTWKGIKNRCQQTNKDHEKYFDRGIRVCESWSTNYQTFLNDMGRAPASTAQIDRVNNNGNYEPGNCRWSTAKENGNNKRNNRFYIIDGKQYNIREAAALLQCNTASIWLHMQKHGRSIEWVVNHFRSRIQSQCST